MKQSFTVRLKNDNWFIYAKKEDMKKCLTDLTATQFTVLTAILVYANTDGVAIPSQRKIADITGMSVTTVNKAVKDLLEKEYLSRELVGTSRKSSVYSTDSNHVFNGNDAVKYWITEYEQEFAGKYIPVWAKDTVGMKKLLKVYGEEQLKQLIRVCLTDYDKRWSTPTYKTPTIGQFTSWLHCQVAEILKLKTEPTVDKWDSVDNSDDALNL